MRTYITLTPGKSHITDTIFHAAPESKKKFKQGKIKNEEIKLTLTENTEFQHKKLLRNLSDTERLLHAVMMRALIKRTKSLDSTNCHNRLGRNAPVNLQSYAAISAAWMKGLNVKEKAEENSSCHINIGEIFQIVHRKHGLNQTIIRNWGSPNLAIFLTKDTVKIIAMRAMVVEKGFSVATSDFYSENIRNSQN